MFLAIEESLPHALKPYMLGPESLALGRKLYAADIAVYSDCVEANNWPAYNTELEVIELPDWVLGNQEIITTDEENAE